MADKVRLPLADGSGFADVIRTEEKGSEIERILEFMERAGKADLDWSLIPNTKPSIQQIGVDDQDRLWIRVISEAASTVYHLFDQEGVRIATRRVANLDEVQGL